MPVTQQEYLNIKKELKKVNEPWAKGKALNTIEKDLDQKSKDAEKERKRLFNKKMKLRKKSGV